MKRTVVIDVPQHLVVCILVGLLLWGITGDFEWAYAYTGGAIVSVLVAAALTSNEGREQP